MVIKSNQKASKNLNITTQSIYYYQDQVIILTELKYLTHTMLHLGREYLFVEILSHFQQI